MNTRISRLKSIQYITIILSVILTASCDMGGIFDDVMTREKVEPQFVLRRELAKNREKELFETLDRLPAREREAMVYLYAYMPLNDLADYNADFFLENVRVALEAKDTFTWGKTIPEKLFRHFVLPYRVNDESPDHFRDVYFKELRDRVIHLSMKEAVLELNHWCHEKVEYRAGHNRPSSPLNTIKTAVGQRDEQSIFTVMALRTIGIPARECEVPRWVHGDASHAWVEAWIDGKWHYLGACEPEPDLDRAWFTEPARRAMMIHTHVFGDYKGPEETLSDSPFYTDINITGNYAKTKKISIVVEDKNQKHIPKADVQFLVYNAAEFVPIAHKRTDTNGMCSLVTGLGDLLVWAYSGNTFGYKKISVPTTDNLVICLNTTARRRHVEDLDMEPPILPEPYPVSQEGKKENDHRLKLEDQLRGDYEASFIDRKGCRTLAATLGLDPVKTRQVLMESRGNWQEISDFLTQTSTDPLLKPWAFPFLQTLSSKDLRDATASVLLGHLKYSFTYSGNLTGTRRNYFTQYILNPRIADECLTDYKPVLHEGFNADFIKRSRRNPRVIAQWIRNNIRIDHESNYYRIPITPAGVFRLRVSDAVSRDIFFVAVCRSFGIPSRLEPVTRVPQYAENGTWKRIYFETEEPIVNGRGYIQFKYGVSRDNKTVPQYSKHFTLARFSNGSYHTLGVEEGKRITDFQTPLEIPAGSYLLVTGKRKPDGCALCRMRFFTVKANQTLDVPVEIR
ncbi:MAG: transglutaminase domain-containing protein [Candidatus Omnitrophota bacterium]